MATEHRLDVEGFGYRHPGANQAAIKSIDFSITPDRPLIVLGSDGAGKSTLLAALAGLVPERMGGTASGYRRLSLGDGSKLELGPEEGWDAQGRQSQGRISLGRPLQGRQTQRRHTAVADAWLERCALLLDDPLAQLTGARARVDEEIAIALECRGVTRAAMLEVVDRSLEAAGIAHLRARHPGTLSVGEAARVAFEAVCIARPTLALFDEPTAHLDAQGREHVLRRIRELWTEEGTLVAIATQGLDAVDDVFLSGPDRDSAEFNPHALVLVAGEIALRGSATDVLAALELGAHGVGPSTRALTARIAKGGSGDAILGVRHQSATLGLAPHAESTLGLAPHAELVPGLAPRGESALGLAPHAESPPVEPEVQPADVVFTGVSGAHPDGTQCLRSIDLVLRPGEITALIGANGAGKTSLAHALVGLIPLSGGKATMAGADVSRLAAPQRSGMVSLAFQRPEDQLFERTVEREVAFGPRCRGLEGARLADAVDRALEQCGLSSVRNRHPYDLTRAGRRWVGLASTLALETPIVALDEPTVGLDHRGVERMKDLVNGLREASRTVLVISHDLDFVGELADQVAVIDGGRIIASGSSLSVLVDDGLLGRAGLSPATAVTVARELGLSAAGGHPLSRRALAQALEMIRS